MQKIVALCPYILYYLPVFYGTKQLGGICFCPNIKQEIFGITAPYKRVVMLVHAHCNVVELYKFLATLH